MQNKSSAKVRLKSECYWFCHHIVLLSLALFFVLFFLGYAPFLIASLFYAAGLHYFFYCAAYMVINAIGGFSNLFFSTCALVLYANVQAKLARLNSNLLPDQLMLP